MGLCCVFFLCAYVCVLLVPAETSGVVLLCFLLAGSSEYLCTSPANPFNLSTCQPGSRFHITGDYHCKIKRLLSELFCLCSLHLKKKTEASSESRRESDWESNRLSSQKSVVTPWLAMRETPQTGASLHTCTHLNPNIHFVSAKDRQNTLAEVSV